MRFLTLLLLAPTVFAQDLITRGADVYVKNCTGYCHGAKGAGGGAPRLAGRGFEDAYISRVIRVGINGTAMPAFATTLANPDLLAVIAYVDSLNGIAPNPNAAAARGSQRTLSPEAARGRSLFSEATRGFGRCSTCHAVDRLGIAITDPIANVPANAAALRALATPKVITASADGESFPALVLSKGVTQVKLYDLTVAPPVLRVFPAASAKIQDGSAWRHGAVIGSYTDAELEVILACLRTVGQAQ
jgi:mono/diheme cytochrome c family protein